MFIQLATGTIGGLFWTRRRTSRLHKKRRISLSDEQLIGSSGALFRDFEVCGWCGRPQSLFVIVYLPMTLCFPQFFTDVFNARGLWMLVMQDAVFYFQFLVAVINLFHIHGRWDSAVGIATRLCAGRSGVRILIRVRYFYLHKIFETGSGAHPVSCSVGTGTFPGREAVGAWS